jgi:hypothetical protein
MLDVIEGDCIGELAIGEVAIGAAGVVVPLHAVRASGRARAAARPASLAVRSVENIRKFLPIGVQTLRICFS